MKVWRIHEEKDMTGLSCVWSESILIFIEIFVCPSRCETMTIVAFYSNRNYARFCRWLCPSVQQIRTNSGHVHHTFVFTTTSCLAQRISYTFYADIEGETHLVIVQHIAPIYTHAHARSTHTLCTVARSLECRRCTENETKENSSFPC